jgi:hypothetical protein
MPRGTRAAFIPCMALEPDRARNVCALLALYFGYCSLYALDPYVANTRVAATGFGLIGLWFALVSAFEGLVDERTHSVP